MACCARCVRSCKSGYACGVVGSTGDAVAWQIVYGSVSRSEDLSLYHICPGKLVLRLVLPGSPIACDRLWCVEYSKPSTLALKKVALDTIVGLVERLRPAAILVDGCEPLVANWPFELAEKVRDSLENPPLLVAKSLGLLSLERVEEMVGVFDAIVVDYIQGICADEMASYIAHVNSVIELASVRGLLAEIHYYLTADKASQVIAVDVAERTRRPMVVIAVDERAHALGYKLVKELRERGYFAHLHQDESYTLQDIVCPYCGHMLVKRRPWGVSVDAREAPEKNSAVCPRCRRRIAPLYLCPSGKKPLAIHREIAVL